MHSSLEDEILALEKISELHNIMDILKRRVS